MNIHILPAQDSDLPVIGNLMRFYVYDMSEHCGWDCPETGLFGGCDALPEYWKTRNPLTDPAYQWPDDRQGYPFLLRVDGKLAGFALISRLGPPGAGVYDMGEFFILRKYRGQGFGRYVAHTMFDRFPGRWQVRQLVDNAPARAFWPKVIHEYTAGAYTEEPERSHGFEFIAHRFCSRAR